jgi:PhnB protein
MRINPYLMFAGDCADAFKFYAEVLGAKIEAMMTYRESPEADKTADDWRDKIMHASLIVGDQILMGSDAPPQYKEEPKGFYVACNVENPEEAERIFEALADQGDVRMPLQETFWAIRFGMLVDRFSVPWMVNCNRPD